MNVSNNSITEEGLVRLVCGNTASLVTVKATRNEDVDKGRLAGGLAERLGRKRAGRVEIVVSKRAGVGQFDIPKFSQNFGVSIILFSI